MSTDQSPERDEASETGPWHDYPASGVPASGVPAQQPWSNPSPVSPARHAAPEVQPTQDSGQWPTLPYSAAPAWPVSGAPQPMAQTSGPPHPMAQTSGPPHPMGMAQASGPPQPWSGPETTWSDPLAGSLDEDSGRYQRRIVPTTPPRKSRLVLGLLIGFLAGLLVAAPTAYFLAPGDNGTAAPTPSTAPGSPAALGAFEQNQLALNRPKFQDDLATLGAPWLPFVTNCLTNSEQGGPKIGPDERAHVLCRYGNAYVHFAQFKSSLERDRARAYRQRLNTESRALAPGLADPSRKPRTSDPAEGTYIEYALLGPDKKTTAGLWWDPEDDRGVAIYVEANWDQILGKSWEPLRDLWQRHS